MSVRGRRCGWWEVFIFGSSKRGFRRELTFIDAVALAVGSMVGSGIYVVVADVAAAGPLAPLVWVLVAVLVAPIVLVYALAGRVVTVSGGEVVYVAAGLGRFLGAFAGIGMFIAYIYVTAALARAFSMYLVGAVGLPDAYEVAVALSIIWVLTVINVLGVKFGGMANTALTVMKLAPLTLFAIAGLVYGSLSNLVGRGCADTSYAPLTAAVAASLWAYLGFEAAAVPAEEFRSSGFVPRALVTSLAIVAALYTAVNASALAMAPWCVVAGSKAPLVDAARNVGAAWLAALLSIGGIVSIAGALAACILSNARRGYALADMGVLPRALAEISGRGVPANALIVQGAAASAMVILLNFTSLYLIADLTSIVPYLLVALATPAIYRSVSGRIPIKILLVAAAATLSSAYLIYSVVVHEPESLIVEAFIAAVAAAAVKRVKQYSPTLSEGSK